MALPNFLLFFIVSALFYAGIASTELPVDSVVSGDYIGAASEAEASDASLRVRVELDQLKSKISLLESRIDERMQELTSKEKTIIKLEMIIEEKSNTLTSLQSQMQLLKINNLRKEIEAQNKKKDVLEARATIAERRIQDLNKKIKNLHRTNDEQKSRILNTRRALEVAEEELVKAKLEAFSISKQLIEVQEAWIPPSLAVHVDHFKSFVVSTWNKHAQPALDVTKEKALEKKCKFEKRLRPHIENFKSEQLPIIREQWLAFVNDFGVHLQSLINLGVDKYHVSRKSIEPHIVGLKEEWIPIITEPWLAFINDFSLNLQSITNMAIDKYHVTRKFVEPHVIRIQQVIHPHLQEVKKFAELYVEQVSSFTKPQIDKTRLFIKPHTKRFLRGYKKFTRKVNVLHQQVQGSIFHMLESHEFTRPLATKELVWYLASALMALPLIFMFNMVSSLILERPKKRAHVSRSGHTRRRAKWAHSER